MGLYTWAHKYINSYKRCTSVVGFCCWLGSLAVAEIFFFFLDFVQLKVIGNGGDPDGHDDDEDEHH